MRKYARALRVHRYVRSRAVQPDTKDPAWKIRGTDKPHDRIAELWWRSMEDYVAAYSSDDGEEAGAALMAEEKRFSDLFASTVWICEKHTIVEA